MPVVVSPSTPAPRSSGTHCGAAGEAGAMLATLKLLIIDDSPGDRDLCKACLQDAALPADVREAEDGTDGLMLLRSEPIDCVMLDYSLPGTTGLDVLQEIRGIDCHVPVVMLTGHGSEDVAV